MTGPLENRAASLAVHSDANDTMERPIRKDYPIFAIPLPGLYSGQALWNSALKKEEVFMPTVTDGKQWLDSQKALSPDEVYALYKTVSDEGGCGPFQCSNRGKELYIRSSNSQEWLLLTSKLARKNFLDMVKAKFCGGEEMLVWYTRTGDSMSKTG